jgi:hypothetical protein
LRSPPWAIAERRSGLGGELLAAAAPGGDLVEVALVRIERGGGWPAASGRAR